MPLEATARNLYAPVQLGPDLSFVVVVIDSAGRVAADSSPNTTVTAAGAGVYNVTFPKAERGFVVGATLVATASDGIFPEVTAFDATAGTIALELSDEADLAGSERIHLVLLLGSS